MARGEGTRRVREKQAPERTSQKQKTTRRRRPAADAAARAHTPPSAAAPDAAPARGSAAGTPDVATDTNDATGYRGTSAPPAAAPNWQQRRYIDRHADLAALTAALEHAHLLAIDAEFWQPRVRGPDEPSHRLALLQIAIDNDCRASYVVDAMRLSDLSPLRPALEAPHILKLFHGIGADARVLATRGLVARYTLDLEAVSRSIFGQRESGLRAMLQRACGIRLDKSLQRADWSRRPLTPAMVAYAARDAEMTLVLHSWLAEHYPWAIALHQSAPDEPSPAIAEWVLPYLDGARPRPAYLAVADAGIADDIHAQEDALREALSAVQHPSQRTRVIRLITDLELKGLAHDVRPYLTSLASDERAAAARAAGRLRDMGAQAVLRLLLDDPVQDVRQAAHLALDTLGNAPTPARARPSGPITWTSGNAGAGAGQHDLDGWQARLRADFGMPPAAAGDKAPGE
jgi:hypothetical protein